MSLHSQPARARPQTTDVIGGCHQAAHVATVAGIARSGVMAERSPCYSPLRGEETERDPRRPGCPAGRGVPLCRSTGQQPTLLAGRPHVPWPSGWGCPSLSVLGPPAGQCPRRAAGSGTDLSTQPRRGLVPPHPSAAPLPHPCPARSLEEVPASLRCQGAHGGVRGGRSPHLLCGSRTRQPWAGVASRPVWLMAGRRRVRPPQAGSLLPGPGASSPPSHGSAHWVSGSRSQSQGRTEPSESPQARASLLPGGRADIPHYAPIPSALRA